MKNTISPSNRLTTVRAFGTSAAALAAFTLSTLVAVAAPPAPTAPVAAPAKPATPPPPPPTTPVAKPAVPPTSGIPAPPPRTIVLVHGAFADGSSWDKVVPLLLAKGYNVVAVHESLASLAADVASTERAIDTQAQGDVILVGHSYGGVVITEAGNHPKVAGLVYVAAFAPAAGESITDLGKGKPAPSWQGALKVDAAGFAWLPPDIVAKDFAQDLPPAESRLVSIKQGPIFTKNFEDKVKVAAWKTKPSWYVRATQDHMILPEAQAAMAKRINAQTTSVPASHVVMVSKPAEVAAVILAAAATPPKPVK